MRRCSRFARRSWKRRPNSSPSRVFRTQSRRNSAAKLQVGKGTIYRHFPSKRELFLAAADRVMRKLQERVESNIVGTDRRLRTSYQGRRGLSRVFRRAPRIRRAVDSRKGLFQGPAAADLLRAPRDQHRAMAAVVSRADRSRARAGNARRTHHRRGEQHAVRNHGDQLFQRPDQTVGSSGKRDARRRFLRDLDRARAAQPRDGG